MTLRAHRRSLGDPVGMRVLLSLGAPRWLFIGEANDSSSTIDRPCDASLVCSEPATERADRAEAATPYADHDARLRWSRRRHAIVQKRTATTGSLTRSWTTSPSSYVRWMAAMPNGDVRIGGYLKRFDSQHRVGHAVIALDETLPPAPPLTMPPIVNAMVRLSDSGLVIGGQFIDVNGARRKNILRLQPNGAIDPAWATVEFDVPINALATDAGGSVYVAPGFSAVLEILPDGTRRSSVSVPSIPYALALDGAGNLYIGHLQGINRAIRSRWVIWSPTPTGRPMPTPASMPSPPTAPTSSSSAVISPPSADNPAGMRRESRPQADWRTRPGIRGPRRACAVLRATRRGKSSLAATS
jgi:hypothetical protein